MIPSMYKVTDDQLVKIRETGVKTLRYYGDNDFQHIEEVFSDDQMDHIQKRMMDTITAEFESIDSDYQPIEVQDDKRSLFFRKLRGQNLLVVTHKENVYELIKGILDIYFTIDRLPDGGKIEEAIGGKKYICVFLDATIPDTNSLTVLTAIRSVATRRKTSVIILTPRIDKIAVMRYKNSGTDNIIIEPYTSTIIQDKLFDALTLDRKT
jgi:PleD family two-component response regulator